MKFYKLLPLTHSKAKDILKSFKHQGFECTDDDVEELIDITGDGFVIDSTSKEDDVKGVTDTAPVYLAKGTKWYFRKQVLKVKHDGTYFWISSDEISAGKDAL